ncbi:MAG: hypothetical protein ACRDMV_01545 [Streptosporangiales bacterium]
MTTPPGDPNASGGYPPPPPGGNGYGYGAPQPQSNTPKILGIIGIICAFFCSPAGIVLGSIGMAKANNAGQSKTLPMVALILSIITLLIGIIANIARMS